MWEIVFCTMTLGFGACLLLFCFGWYSALLGSVLWTALGTSLEEGFLLGGRFCFNSELTDEDQRFFTQARRMWIWGARQSCIYIYHNNHSYMVFVLCLDSRKRSGLLGNYRIVVESCALQHSAVRYTSKVRVDIPGTAEVPEWCFSFWEPLFLLTIGTVDSRSELCVSSQD